MNKCDLINKENFKTAIKNKRFIKWAFGGNVSIHESIKYWIDNHSDLYMPEKGESIRSVFTKIYEIYKKSVVRNFRTTK